MRFEKKIGPLLKEREKTFGIYKKLIDKATQEKDRDKVAQLRSEGRHEDRMIQYEIDCVVTGELTSEAQSLFVPLPSRDNEKYWQESALSGDDRKYLSDEGVSVLRDSIRDERRKRHDNKRATVELVVKVVTMATGLIGACIGLASVLKN